MVASDIPYQSLRLAMGAAGPESRAYCQCLQEQPLTRDEWELADNPASLPLEQFSRVDIDSSHPWWKLSHRCRWIGSFAALIPLFSTGGS